jgi:hypothetical protein
MAGPTPAKRTARKAAPRKAAPAKAAAQSATRVVLDLDNLSKEKAFPGLKLPTAPFVFLHNGVEYELRDPRDSDWKMAFELAGNPFLLMRTALVGADDPVDDPTEDEVRACRQRLALSPEPPEEGTPEAEEEKAAYPEGVTPALIDRFTAAHLPGWKLNALFDRWHEYWKIDMSNGKGILQALLGKSDSK